MIPGVTMNFSGLPAGPNAAQLHHAPAHQFAITVSGKSTSKPPTEPAHLETGDMAFLEDYTGKGHKTLEEGARQRFPARPRRLRRQSPGPRRIDQFFAKEIARNEVTNSLAAMGAVRAGILSALLNWCSRTRVAARWPAEARDTSIGFADPGDAHRSAGSRGADWPRTSVGSRTRRISPYPISCVTVGNRAIIHLEGAATRLKRSRGPQPHSASIRGRVAGEITRIRLAWAK